jgi:hypothetical protein
LGAKKGIGWRCRILTERRGRRNTGGGAAAVWGGGGAGLWQREIWKFGTQLECLSTFGTQFVTSSKFGTRDTNFFKMRNSPLFLSATSCEMTLLPSSSSFGRLQAMVMGHDKSARVSFGQASRAPTKRARARKPSSYCGELRPSELPRVSSGQAS